MPVPLCPRDTRDAGPFAPRSSREFWRTPRNVKNYTSSHDVVASGARFDRNLLPRTGSARSEQEHPLEPERDRLLCLTERSRGAASLRLDLASAGLGEEQPPRAERDDAVGHGRE